MYRLSVESVSPGMVVYEDIYTADKKIILAADTLLTPEKIQLLMKHHITSVPLAEPLEVGLSRYQHLQNHPRFQKFVEVYNQSLTSFSKMIKNIESGLEINIDKFLSEGKTPQLFHGVQHCDSNHCSSSKFSVWRTVNQSYSSCSLC